MSWLRDPAIAALLWLIGFTILVVVSVGSFRCRQDGRGIAFAILAGLYLVLMARPW